MILLKTALKTLRKNLGLNIFIFIQFTAVLLVLSFMVSSLYLRFRTYIPFRDYFEAEGYFCCFDYPTDTDVVRTTDTGKMLSELSASDAVAVHQLILQYSDELNNSDADEQLGNVLTPDTNMIIPEGYSYDDEIIERYTPELSKGRWIDVNSNEIEAVVSANSGLSDVGETIILWAVMKDETGYKKFYSFKAKIVGELRDNAEIFCGTGRSFDNPSYRNAFYPYSAKTEGKPLVLLSSSALSKNAREIYQPVHPIALIRYDENASAEEMKKDKKILMDSGCKVIFKLSEIDVNSKTYLYEQLYQLLPLTIIMLILAVVSCISGSALSTRKRQRDYANYYLVGLTWNKCILINLIQSLIIEAAALVTAFSAAAIIQATALSESFVIIINGWLILALFAALAVFTAASLIMPALMLRSGSPKEILQSE